MGEAQNEGLLVKPIYMRLKIHEDWLVVFEVQKLNMTFAQVGAIIQIPVENK